MERSRESRGFEEAEIRQGLRAGGRVQSAFIVLRPAANPVDVRFVAYLRVSWLSPGYHLLETYRHRADRTYRDLGRLMLLLQDDFGIGDQPIPVFRAGSPRLQRFRDLRPQDAAVSSQHADLEGAG